ncbi:MAG TPA: chitobiase/beta-hexosaminidase C-terminal domain-containing protein, partial [Opitutaceae bacterium]|nr:chitobiase/beta-hexosaminidase C-terminal domain-containing protein [Opitutaceae bacterium]
TTTLKAVAYEVGYTDSTVTTGLYTIGTFSQVVAPIFSPGAGTYTSTVSVAITTTTTGASIRYTTDGSTPSETAGTLYSSAIPISVTTTLNAIAYKSGMTDSTVTTGLYTIIPTTRSLTGSSGDGFHALALTAAQTGTFTATFDATPSVSPENAVVGLSKGVATAYTGLSCIARFNTSGQIDAYNGTAYGTSTITYIANLSYHFRLVVNVPAHTYSVYVTPSGGSELTVGLNYAFRVAQTSLDTWNIDVNATPAGCKLTAVNLNP